MNSHVGLSNVHKLLAMNLPEPEAKINWRSWTSKAVYEGALHLDHRRLHEDRVRASGAVMAGGIQIAASWPANNATAERDPHVPDPPSRQPRKSSRPAGNHAPATRRRTAGRRGKSKQQKMEFNAITLTYSTSSLMQALGGAKTPAAALAADAGAAPQAGGAAKPKPDAALASDGRSGHPGTTVAAQLAEQRFVEIVKSVCRSKNDPW